MKTHFNHVVRALILLALAYSLVLAESQAYADDATKRSDDIATGQTQGLREEPVQFENGDVVLSGALLRPITGGVLPAVVIVHGSGPNEGSGYRLYAEQFARAGIAALIYDKRGSGRSTGDWRYRTLEDLTGDALAGVAYLKTRSEIDPRQIGLWGISQGSWIVPLAASRSKNVAFVIAVAADGVSPTQQEMYHKDEMFRHLAYSDRARDTALKVWRLIFDWLVLVADGTFPVPKGFMEPELSGAYLGLNHDPIPDWEQVTQPTLIIYGEEDRLTPVAESVARIDAALKKTAHSDYTIVIFPRASHTITLGKTRLEFDWDKEFAPGYFETMNQWVLARSRGHASSGQKQESHPYSPSADFAADGRYGKLPWYGRALPQMGMVLFFVSVFLSGLAVCIVRAMKAIFRKPHDDKPHYDKSHYNATRAARWSRAVAGLVSGLSLALLFGFVTLVAQAVFPQGMDYWETYTIPHTLRALPLLGILTASLIAVLATLTAMSWRDFHSKAARLHQGLIALAGVTFVPWLYYWNLIGPML